MGAETKSKEITFSVSVTPSDQLLTDIYTTALEGGVDYWATVHEYKHVDEVRAVIGDSEDNTDRQTVTLDTVREGLRRLVSGECQINIPETDEPIRAMARGVLLDPDYDWDAGDADNIVQSGLFNEIVYG